MKFNHRTPTGRVDLDASTGPRPPTPGSGRTLFVASAATLLVLIDFTTIFATLQDTASELEASTPSQTWALSGMSLGLAAALLTAGAIADTFGRRRILRAGVVGLAVSSAVVGAAPTIELLVIGRVFQGVAGAAILAAALGLIGNAFPSGSSRTRATGIWGAMLGAGVMIGPLVGASLAAIGDWRTAYWFEAVLAVTLGVAIGRIPESLSTIRRPVDLAGATVLSTSMVAMTAGFVYARTSWTSGPTIGFLIAGTTLLIVFAAVETRGSDPMLNLGLLRDPDFAASVIGATVTGLSTIALLSYLPSFLQRAMNLSVFASATVLAAWSGTSTILAWHARRLPTRIDARLRLMTGFAISAAGLASLSGLSASSGWMRLLPGLLVTGIGTGLVNAALGGLAVSSVPAGDAAMGSGANLTARYLGGGAGIALVISIATANAETDPTAGLIRGWNIAAVVAAATCATGAALIAGLTKRVRRLDKRSRTNHHNPSTDQRTTGHRRPPGNSTAFDERAHGGQ